MIILLWYSLTPLRTVFNFYRTVTVIVVSRLAYRKGIDLLVAAAPRICAAFPNVRFVVGTRLSCLHVISLVYMTLPRR
jgi:glycosyltransferase involved in cell wall biosynthesis